MTDQRGVRRVGLAFIQQSFQPPCGPIEEKGFDSVGHILFYHSTQPSALSLQPRNFNRKVRDGRKRLMKGNVCAFALFASFAVNRCLS